MGVFDRLIGKADVQKGSRHNIERFLGDGEVIIAVFAFMRDEIVMTNRGVFTIDVQGLTGSKKQYKYFPLKSFKYVSYESAGTFDLDADIKIGVDGNTAIVNNVAVNQPLSFKIPKPQAREGEVFFKMVKAAIDG
jgi:hypothetical protein